MIVGHSRPSLLIGLNALDPPMYATVALTMLARAFLAGLGAACRLRRVMPMDALRTEIYLFERHWGYVYDGHDIERLLFDGQ